MFSAFLFATAKVAYVTAVIILHLILHFAVHIYDVHIFMTSVVGSVSNNDGDVNENGQNEHFYLANHSLWEETFYA